MYFFHLGVGAGHWMGPATDGVDGLPRRRGMEENPIVLEPKFKICESVLNEEGFIYQSYTS